MIAAAGEAGRLGEASGARRLVSGVRTLYFPVLC